MPAILKNNGGLARALKQTLPSLSVTFLFGGDELEFGYQASVI